MGRSKKPKSKISYDIKIPLVSVNNVHLRTQDLNNSVHRLTVPYPVPIDFVPFSRNLSLHVSTFETPNLYTTPTPYLVNVFLHCPVENLFTIIFFRRIVKNSKEKKEFKEDPTIIKVSFTQKF